MRKVHTIRISRACLFRKYFKRIQQGRVEQVRAVSREKRAADSRVAALEADLKAVLAKHAREVDSAATARRDAARSAASRQAAEAELNRIATTVRAFRPPRPAHPTPPPARARILTLSSAVCHWYEVFTRSVLCSLNSGSSGQSDSSIISENCAELCCDCQKSNAQAVVLVVAVRAS